MTMLLLTRLVLLTAASLLILGKTDAWIPIFIRGRIHGALVGSPVVSKTETGRSFPDLWFSQRLDHFKDTDTRRWKQRYFMNDDYYKEGGPVFLMIDGEGVAESAWMNHGTWMRYAMTYNAMCFMVEHRFYGKSHPTSDTSTDNLQFLSSEQALEDLAYFIQYATEKYNIRNAPWITFGGSYAGMLSAWMRLKYPHLIHAAVATSAPVKAILNFKEYIGVVRDSMATTGPACNKAVHAATMAIEEQLKTVAGRQNLKKIFTLCDDIDPTNENDISNLFLSLATNLMIITQANKVNNNFEEMTLRNLTIDAVCRIMSDVSLGDPILRYAKVTTLSIHAFGKKCTDFVYDSMIADMKRTGWNSSAAVAGRPWLYQTCTEFGYYASSDLQDQPFGHLFPASFEAQRCVDIFGPEFDIRFIRQQIAATNTRYGADNLHATRVVLPNGSLDPWHPLGVLESLGPETLAMLINGTAHCANMYPPAPDDPPGLVQARDIIEMLIGRWLKMPKMTE